MSIKETKPWDWPNCPKCKSDVFVNSESSLKDYYCHSCKHNFNRDYATGSDNGWPLNYNMDHAELLSLMQESGNTYHKANHYKDELKATQFGRRISTLRENGLVEKWSENSNNATWTLTEKGKEADPMELLE